MTQRFYCLTDDEAGLWEKGQTGDDRGVDSSGRHLLKFDHYDDVVSIMDPYTRGLIARMEEAEARKPPGFSDAELDEYLDAKEQDDE